MFEKVCRLSIASRYYFGGGGGGGSSNISGPYGTRGGNRNFPTELPFINQGYGNQFDQFNQFGANNPLLNAANTGAQDFFKNIGSLTGPLQALQQQTPGFFSGLQNEVQGIQGQVPGLQNQLQGIFGGLGSLIGQIPGLQQQSQQGYGNLMSQLPGLQNQLSGLSNQTQGLLSGLPNVNRLTNPLRQTLGDYGSNIQNVFNPVVQSGGALTGQQARDATQQARAFAPSGSLQNPGAIASEVLNRDTAKDQRLGLYSGLENAAAGQQSGLAGQIQNLIGSDTGLRSSLLQQQGQLAGQQGNLLGLGGSLLGQNAGIQQGLLNTGGQLYGQQGQNVGQQQGALGFLSALTGQKGGLFNQQVQDTQGLSSGQQALQTGGLNQLLGTLGGGTSAFGGLTNPILGYIGNLFSGNQQTQIAQAQINAQQNQANSAKGAGAASGIGSVVSSVLPLLIGLSDERAKTKLKDTGIETKEGVPLQTFEYKTNPGVRFLGATAQDIEKKLPSAVFTDPRSGLKLIDTTQFPIMQISALKPTKKAA